MDWQSFKNFWIEKKWKNLKKSDWLVVGLVGVLLLVIAIPLDEETNENRSTGETEEQQVPGQAAMSGNAYEKGEKNGNQDYIADLEARLESVLTKMEGVGEVEVMITIADEGETIIEKDTKTSQTTTSETDSTGGSRSVSEKASEEQTIYIESEGETYPYIQKETMPTIEGVVVVAEGGDSSVVVSNISESVKALLPVEVHRIKVVKMCSKEE